MRQAIPIREKHDGALGDRPSVRVWMRMQSCTIAIEKEIQRRLGLRGMTLPRFDVLAALDRHQQLTMGQLSKTLLVSNGNVTALVRKLVQEGLIEMTKLPEDRRTSIVKLTPEGQQLYSRLSSAHQDWIDDMLSGLDYTLRERLYVALGALKISIARASARRRPR